MSVRGWLLNSFKPAEGDTTGIDGEDEKATKGSGRIVGTQCSEGEFAAAWAAGRV
jgi:hypothetical protein